MSSKFDSSKSYPRPPHVCRAPIAGNPQPPPGPADIVFGTWIYRRNFPSDPSDIIQPLILRWDGATTWIADPFTSPEGWIADFAFTWFAGFDFLVIECRFYDGPTPHNPIGWAVEPPTSIDPWYQDPLPTYHGATYDVAIVSLHN